MRVSATSLVLVRRTPKTPKLKAPYGGMSFRILSGAIVSVNVAFTCTGLIGCFADRFERILWNMTARDRAHAGANWKHLQQNLHSNRLLQKHMLLLHET